MTIRASQLMGAVVVDRQGARLGKVSDLLIEDSTSASIAYALVELEQSSRGERTVAVPWSVLAGGGRRQVVLDVSRDTLSQLRDIIRP
jgi:sporulation protein YlmC with PRC-barrel domain